MISYTIIDEFIKTAKENMNNVCLVFDNKEYAYKDIEEISNGVAKSIEERINDIQIPILLFCDHPLQIVCSIIGIMKSRNIVVPIYNNTPTNRVLEIIKACNIKAYMSLNEHNEINLLFNEFNYNRVDEFFYNGCIEDAAYIIYTSGTTGKSKGVLAQQKGLINSVTQRNTVLKIDSNCHTINLLGYSFDGFLMTLFSPLVTGCRIYFPKSISNMDEICSIIENSPISTFICTPTFLKSLLSYEAGGVLDNINMISLAGEKIPSSLVEMCIEKYPQICIANEYGPTENTICTSINPDVRGQEVISAGKIIENVKAQIVNENGVCAQREIGELFVTGVGLSKGYVNDAELTNEKFININNQIWYKTGDLAYWNNDELVILDRKDSQVKINGYRIDLSEIEGVLLKYKGIDACIVIYDDSLGINAYVVSQVPISREESIKFLRNYLPEYMIPTSIIQIETIPIRESGKIDVKALSKMKVLNDSNSKLCEEISEIVSEICGMFKAVLSIDKCSENSNFYSLGGNSLTGVILSKKINKHFHSEIELEDIRANATPILLANRILNLQSGFESVDVKPFNKFWFATCYFTSVLALLEHSSIPLAPFIRAFTILNVEYNNSYYLEYNYKKNISEIFNDSGMAFDGGIFDDDFDSKILPHIMKNRVVMLHVDCYYLPYCKEKYNKEHYAHVVAITSYNEENKTFNIIDQETLESVSFTYYKVDLDNLRAAAYAEIVNREAFDNVDFVAVYPLSNWKNNNEIQSLDGSQFNFVVAQTIEYLRKKPEDVVIVIQRFLNYIKVEKEVFEYLKDDEKLAYLKKKESKLMRLLMEILSLKNISADSLIELMLSWEQF